MKVKSVVYNYCNEPRREEGSYESYWIGKMSKTFSPDGSTIERIVESIESRYEGEELCCDILFSDCTLMTVYYISEIVWA